MSDASPHAGLGDRPGKGPQNGPGNGPDASPAESPAESPSRAAARRWTEAASLFAEAVELPPAERAAFLETVCAGDAALRAQVDRLLAADDQAGDFLDVPAAARLGFDGSQARGGDADAPSETNAPLLESGAVLNERFRIVRLLGEGGMGQVYEGFDEELRTPLALKVIRPEIANSPGALRRFRQEVRLARTITHPNVCRTFDLERGFVTAPADAPAAKARGELLFLTMEFLDGETLHARLRRDGAMTPGTALEIARGIAAALDAAHAAGVVHQDVKPHNILLAGSRVVVTDFGLARRDPAFAASARSSATLPGQAAGTLAYMSPEQIAGGEISARTDVYSFGLVLAEMLTGAAVFSSASSVDDMARRFQDAPLRSVRLPAGTPPNWRTAIDGCLALEPEARTRGAGVVVGQLDGPPARRQRWRPPFAGRAAFGRPSTATIVTVIATLCAVLSAVLLLPRFDDLHRVASGVAPGSVLYLPPVRNETGMARLDDVSTLLTTALSQSARFSLLDAGRAGEMLERMGRKPGDAIDDATAREVAMRTHAPRVLLARMVRRGAGLELQLDLQTPDTSPRRFRRHWARGWTCCTEFRGGDATIPPDLLRIVRDASDWVRQTAGEGEAEIGSLDLPVDEVTTMDWDALAEYARAQRLSRADRPADAVIALRSAVRHDPAFALAYARLGDLLFSIARNQEGLEAYLKALQAGEQRRLTRRERDFLRGIYANDTWDYATAETIFRDSTVYYEQDYLGWFYRGSALTQLGRLPEAVAALRRAGQLNPASPAVPVALGPVLLSLGDRRGALAEADKLAQNGHAAEAAWLRGDDAYARGDMPAVEAQLALATRSGRLHGTVLRLEASMAMETGHPEKALEWLHRALAEDTGADSQSMSGEDHIAVAAVECAMHAYAACIADEAEGVRLNAAPINLRNASAALNRALQAAPAREAGALRHALEKTAATPLSASYGVSAEVVHHQLNGDLLLARGDTAGAVREYRGMAVRDAPTDAGLRLALALTAVARRETDAARRAALCREAEPTLQQVDSLRARLWYAQDFFLPGIYADALAARRFAATGAAGRP